jgi:CheY-like chemotaxis protein
VLRSQPACFPSDNGTISAGAVTHPAAGGGPIRITGQAIHTLLAQVGEVLSPKRTFCHTGSICQVLFRRAADFFCRKKGGTTWRWSSPKGRSSLGPITVIGLIASDADRRLLSGICSRNRWNLLFADTCEEARIALDKLKAPVVLCDRDLPGKGWRGTVEDLASSPHRACIILISGVVDTYLWDEVVRAGGFDVLSKPLREDDVVRAVRLAWSYWNSATRTAAIPGSRQAQES